MPVHFYQSNRTEIPFQRRVDRGHNQKTRLAGGRRGASVRSCLACCRRCTAGESSGSRHVAMRILLVSCRENTAQEVWTSTDKTGQKGRMTLGKFVKRLSCRGWDRSVSTLQVRLPETGGCPVHLGRITAYPGFCT